VNCRNADLAGTFISGPAVCLQIPGPGRCKQRPVQRTSFSGGKLLAAPAIQDETGDSGRDKARPYRRNELVAANFA
jgi:hypothetical protein